MKQLKLIVISILIILVAPYFSHAQHEGKARLTGTVFDTEGNALDQVTVKLFSLKAHSGFEVQTDKNGVWKAMWIRGGQWDIDFEKPGYETRKISTHLKEDSKIVTLETVMKKIKGMVLRDNLVEEFEKANKLFAEKKIDEALAAYQSILEKHPDSYIININLGNCYFEKKEYEKAIQAYREVLKKEPANNRALLSLGNSYSNMNDIKKALEYYKKIQVEQIQDPVVLYNIGIFHFNSGDMQGAVSFLKRSVEVKKEFPDGWYQLGMTYMGLGQNDKAVECFQYYLELEPDSPQAKTAKDILAALKK